MKQLGILGITVGVGLTAAFVAASATWGSLEFSAFGVGLAAAAGWVSVASALLPPQRGNLLRSIKGEIVVPVTV